MAAGYTPTYGNGIYGGATGYTSNDYVDTSPNAPDVQPGQSQATPNKLTILVNGIPQQFPYNGDNGPEDQKIDAAIKAGGVPIDQNGNKMDVSQPYGPGGGYLFNNQPLNYVFNQTYLPGQEDALRLLGIETSPKTVAKPPGTNAPPTGTGSGSGSDYGLGNFGDLMNLSPIPSIPNINLGAMPEMAGQFSPEFLKNYWGQTGDVEGELSKIYQTLQLPTMNAAQLDTSSIPAAQNSDALNFLLSGKGFQPDILDRLKAGVTDTAAQAGRSARGSARLMGEQAGLAGSPATMALEAQANRNQGAATQQGLNQVEIENANQGLTNLRGGAAMANQNAIQQAANIFAGMQQNVANVQQANATNTQNSNERQMAGANAQAQAVGSAGQNLNSAQTSMQQGANAQNASNAANWNLNQAQLNRQASIYNTGTQENRYGQAFQGLLSLINGANPSSYNVSGASLGTTPNLGYANLFQNFGNQLLNGARG